MSFTDQDIRRQAFEAKMERDGLKLCAECGDYCSDAVPCTDRDGPIRDMCGDCQEEWDARPVDVG